MTSEEIIQRLRSSFGCYGVTGKWRIAHEVRGGYDVYYVEFELIDDPRYQPEFPDDPSEGAS